MAESAPLLAGGSGKATSLPGTNGRGTPSRAAGGIQLDWVDINVEVDQPLERNSRFERIRTFKLPVLRNVSGAAAPGQVLAIMGPSGAGKTSLLNVLTGRMKQNSGLVLANGVPSSQGHLRSLSVCVMQDDVLLRKLSVRECLLFSARLRLPGTMTAAAKEQRVADLIVQLGLEKCASTWIEGLSGGERKRAAIGVELVTDPRLLFLDEPTSGLDSSTALNVMQIVGRLARDDGRTVITTIHQPSTEIFALFHRLMLLGNGRTVYDGPASDALDYFSALGYPCPLYNNPADYFIKILSRDDSPQFQERVEQFADSFAKRAASETKLVLGGTGLNTTAADETAEPIRAGVSLAEEFGQLALRSLKTFAREPLTLRVRLGQAIVIGLLISLFFFDVGGYVVDIKNRLGALFIAVTAQILPNVFGLVLTFPLERAVFMREQDNRMYGINAYYTAKMFSELPFMMLLPLLFTVVVYWLVGFNNSGPEHFLIFYLTMFLTTLNAQSLGMMVGCAISDPTAALAVAPAMMIPLMLLAGFFVDLSTIPTWFSWLQYLSPFKYGFEMLVVNEFTGLEIECEPSIPVCPISSGDDVLTYLGLSVRNIGVGIVALLVISVGLHIIACVFLHLAVYRRRHSNVRS